MLELKLINMLGSNKCNILLIEPMLELKFCLSYFHLYFLFPINRTDDGIEMDF